MKALVNNSVVYTPDYPIKIKDLAIGQTVFDSLGRLVKVLDVTSQGLQNTYKITFSDFTTIKCSLETSFDISVFTRQNEFLFNETFDVDKMIEMIQEGFLLKIKIPNFVKFNLKPVELDSYTVGVLFASNCNFNNIPKDSFNHISEQLSLYKVNDKYFSNKYKDYFKFNSIPTNYMNNTSKIRLDLLRGIMDVKGCIENNNYVLNLTTNKQRDQVLHLLNSLGAKIKIPKNDGSGRNTVLFTLPSNINRPFKYSSYSRLFCNFKYFYKYITKIELLEKKKDMTSITVDSKGGLFLTEGFTPIHST